MWGQGSVYSIALALQVGSGLVVLPILTRLLDPAEYGLVALAILVFTLVRVAASAGLGVVAVRDWFRFADGPLRARRLMLASVGTAVLLTLSLSVLLEIWPLPFGGADSATVISLAVWMALPGSIQGVCQEALRAAQRPWGFVGVSFLAGPGAQLSGLGALALAATPSASAYIAGLLIGTIVSALVGVLLTKPWRGGRPRIAETVEGLRIGSPFVLHGMGWVLLALGDRAIVERLEGVAAAGRYQLAYTVGTLTLALLTAVSSAWGPIIYSAPRSDRWTLLSITTLSILRALAAASALLALSLPLLLRLLAPPSYDPEEMTQVAGIVALAVVPYVAYAAYSHVLTWKGRTGVFAWAALASAVVNLALVTVLVPPLGLVGAAIATTVGYAVLSVLITAYGRRVVAVPWQIRECAEVAGLATVGCLAGALIPLTLAGGTARVILLLSILVLLVPHSRRSNP